jgi:hypothetical protein
MIMGLGTPPVVFNIYLCTDIALMVQQQPTMRHQFIPNPLHKMKMNAGSPCPMRDIHDGSL